MIFRTHKINRTFKGKYSTYQQYKTHLAEDFSHRCAYCNLRDKDVTTYFEIDHFVPQAEIEKHNGLEYLVTDYENLVYACKLCNGAKSNLFEGDLLKNPYDNTRFYNPVTTDYNTIFFRDRHGTISSKDKKGRASIIDLKLYRPIHNLAWICEQLDDIIEKLAKNIENETNAEKLDILKQAHYEALIYHKKCRDLFIASYNSKTKMSELIGKI